MKRASNGRKLALVVTGPDGAAPADRLYLQQQMSVAQAGLRDTLTHLRHSLPSLLDPRPWIKHHPLASTAVLFSAALTAGRALAGQAERRGPEGLYALYAGLLRSTRRALLGAALAELIRGRPDAPALSSAAGSVQTEDEPG